MLVAPLSDRLLSVHGPDARAWLQGFVTHDVLGLEPGGTRYALILDEKGRVLADPTLHRPAAKPETIYLLLPADRVEAVREHLGRRIVTEEVELTVLPYEGTTLQGASSASLLGALVCFPHDRTGLGGFDAFDLLGHTPSGRDDSAAIEQARIHAGIPRLGVDIEATTLAAEAGLHDALHFGKGCYLGQEVVARLAHRGQTTRELRRVALTAPLPAGEAPIARGDRLVVQEPDGPREVGTITSFAAPYGLALIRRRWFEPGQQLEVGNSTVTVLPDRVRGHVALAPENDPGFRGNKPHRALVS